MKIAIISAMSKERRLIMPVLEDVVEAEIDGLKVYKGRMGANEVMVAECGIGKVNAAINVYKVIKNFSPELLINTGVAGGGSYSTRIGDLLVADYVAYHDVWCGPGTEPGVADGMEAFIACDKQVIEIAHELFDGNRLQVGLICTGDKFIASAEEILAIQSLFPQVVAVDMESAAIAQVCFMHGVRFNIIRVISDTPGSGSNIEEYKNFWTEAPEKTFRAVEAILKRL